MRDEESNHIADDTSQPTGNPPIPPQTGCTPVDEEHDRQKSKRACYRRLHKIPIWVEAACAIALVIITWTYAYYAKQQWQTMHDTYGEIQKQTCAAIKAADAAKGAAATAGQTLRFYKEQSILDQRPWVYTSFSLTAEPEQGKDAPKIGIWTSNTGKTPALSLVTFYETFTAPSEPSMPDFSKTKPVSQGLLPPSIDRGVVSTEPVTSVMKELSGGLPAYNAGKTFIYVVGRVDYRDGSGKRYWTSFCAYHTHGTAPNIFSFCLRNNNVGEYK